MSGRKQWLLIEKAAHRQEVHAQRAFMATFPCVVLAIAAFAFMRYFHEWFPAVGPICAFGAAGFAVYGLYQVYKSRHVNKLEVTCPYCKEKNLLIKSPESEFRCDHCQRMIPAENGLLLQVFEVRCGYCNTLNFYNERSTGLICESCNRVIPISVEEAEDTPTKAFEMFTVHDDDLDYNLALVDSGPKTEEMIDCLQHMLALNRNQVKQMFDELPVTLLTGVPKKKAELLSAQIASHGGVADIEPSKAP